MDMELKNQIIADYLKERFNETQKDYPGIFNHEKYDRAVEMFKDNQNNVEYLKLLIDEMIEQEIDIYIKIREKDKKLYELLHAHNQDLITYEKLKLVQEKIKKLVDKADLKLYLSGGLVPYLLLNQNSERLHNDMDNICKLEDMPKFRELFKQAGLYDAKWDSLNFARDGKDYGFEFKVAGVPVGIYPFTYTDGILTQYIYDPYNTRCKEKMMPLQSINDYVFTYKSADGKTYDTQSLEILKKAKDITGRKKDKVDSIKISQYGIRQDVYDRLTLPIETKNKKASELKTNISNKKKEWQQMRQLVMSIANKQNIQKQQNPSLNDKPKVLSRKNSDSSRCAG